MKAKITDVGIPIAVVTGFVGFNVGFEYDGKHSSVFVKPGEDRKLALSSAINKQEMQEKARVEATKFAEEVKKLIGYEIDIP